MKKKKKKMKQMKQKIYIPPENKQQITDGLRSF